MVEENNDQHQTSVRRIWQLVWPILLYNLLEMSVGLADLVMVRSLGMDATVAVGVCRQITFLIEAVAIGITAGATTRNSPGLSESGDNFMEWTKPMFVEISLSGEVTAYANTSLAP